MTIFLTQIRQNDKVIYWESEALKLGKYSPYGMQRRMSETMTSRLKRKLQQLP
jgi:hypothetical protein